MKAVNNYIIIDLIKNEPKKVGGLILTDLTDVPQVLPDFSLYRQDRFVKIVLPGDVFSEGLSGTGAVGTATVTIS